MSRAFSRTVAKRTSPASDPGPSNRAPSPARCSGALSGRGAAPGQRVWRWRSGSRAHAAVQPEAWEHFAYRPPARHRPAPQQGSAGDAPSVQTTLHACGAGGDPAMIPLGETKQRPAHRRASGPPRRAPRTCGGSRGAAARRGARRAGTGGAGRGARGPGRTAPVGAGGDARGGYSLRGEGEARGRACGGRQGVRGRASWRMDLEAGLSGYPPRTIGAIWRWSPMSTSRPLRGRAGRSSVTGRGE